MRLCITIALLATACGGNRKPPPPSAVEKAAVEHCRELATDMWNSAISGRPEPLLQVHSLQLIPIIRRHARFCARLVIKDTIPEISRVDAHLDRAAAAIAAGDRETSLWEIGHALSIVENLSQIAALDLREQYCSIAERLARPLQ